MADAQQHFFLFGIVTGLAISASVQYIVHCMVVKEKIKAGVAARLDPNKTEKPPSNAEDSEADSPGQRGRPVSLPIRIATSVRRAISPDNTTNSVATSLYGLSPQSFLASDTIARSSSLLQLDPIFSVPSTKLHQIVVNMVSEMRKGLARDGEKLKMIPSYVVSLPTGNEVSTVLALDLGGSNFRVCQVAFEGQGRVRNTQRKYVVSESLKTGPVDQLFDFFAECVQKFLAEVNADASLEAHLGFTFSFPVHQTAINAGTLMHWNKGFRCANAVGNDVVSLLRDAFKRKSVNVNVSALVNDTVGALVAHAYHDPQTYIAVILGTGTNAAYVESLRDVAKWEGQKKGQMIINTEWGAYDEPSVLPITKYDQQLDRATSNPKAQIFEKMISGLYLGEIVRLILVDLVSSGEIFKGRSSAELLKPYHFDTAYMSRVERDHSLELSDTKNLFEDVLGVPSTSLYDRRIVKHICELVGTRAARLTAAGVAAILTKINRLNACTVAFDGSVFEHYPHFVNRMRDALREILGITADNIVFEQSRDGSGQGAALIAALHA